MMTIIVITAAVVSASVIVVALWRNTQPDQSVTQILAKLESGTK